MQDMIKGPADLTPLQNRTRNAILVAAVSVFMSDRSTSLAEVAERAGVARSTLHRYFPERADLIDALRMYAKEQVATVVDQARIDEGPAGEALLRLCLGYLDVWDTVMWDYMEAEAAGKHPDNAEDEVLTSLIERGYADGSIDPAIPNAWIQHALYAMVYTAWDYTRSGHTRHEAMKLCETAMRKIITPPAQEIIAPPPQNIITPPPT